MTARSGASHVISPEGSSKTKPAVSARTFAPWWKVNCSRPRGLQAKRDPIRPVVAEARSVPLHVLGDGQVGGQDRGSELQYAGLEEVLQIGQELLDFC
jgi:hypothetical protein